MRRRPARADSIERTRMSPRRALSLIFAAAALARAPAQAQDHALAELSLMGVDSVQLVVELSEADIELSDALTAQALRALRSFGIAVVSSADDGSVLSLKLAWITPVDGWRFYAMSAKFLQKIIIPRSPDAPAFASTWSQDVIGTTEAEAFPERTRETAARLLHAFGAAHSRVNP